MKKITSANIVAAAIVFALLAMIVANSENYSTIAKTVLDRNVEDESGNIQDSASSILKDNFANRDSFLDIYGLSKKVLGERVIGDYEYVLDEGGIMQHVGSIGESDRENYITSVKNLMLMLNERGIPCVDVNLPDRGESFSAADEFGYNCKRFRETEDKIISFGVNEFNCKERLIDTGIISHNDFFLHTDIHLTTQAEFIMAKSLTEYLTDEFSIAFPDSETVYDQNMYDWQGYEFCGNFCGYTGKKYAGVDTFQTFMPKFETQMKITLPDGNIKQGAFADVMTNGYGEDTTYWITNYGQWPSLYYTYDNLKYPYGPKFLVLADSIFMRANTFLALNASRLTVFDPRFISGNEYVIHCLLDDDYDAVIICHTDYFNNNLFISDIDLPETVIPCSNISYKGMWLDNVNSIDLNSGEYEQGKILKSMYLDGKTVYFNGWAADFNVNMPLSALYLKAGDKLIKCNYGIERTSVSDYFQNENLKMTGFNVSIPVSYIEDIDKIEYILVGNDGSYRFETVEYEICD